MSIRHLDHLLAPACVAVIGASQRPASVGATPVDPEIAVRVTIEREPVPTRAAISNSFAFGGSNVSVLVGATP